MIDPPGDVFDTISYTSPARGPANAVSIDLNLDDFYNCGTYANGYDYWCVENSPGAGVTVNSYTPAYASGRNGAMIDPPIATGPSAQQSYDDRDGGSWTPGLLVTVPITVDAGESLIVAQSRPTGNECGGAAGNGWVDGYGILTVVASAPADGTFRPPYHANKTGFTTYTIAGMTNLSTMPALDPATYGSHSFSHTDVDALFDKPAANYSMYPARGEHLSSCYMQGDGYGGRVISTHGPYLIELLYGTMDAEKTAAVVSVVQHGLDILAATDAGWESNAGGGIGCFECKTLASIAAAVLDDAALRAIVDGKSDEKTPSTYPRAWHQDQFTYIGDHGDPLNGWPISTSTSGNSERRDFFKEVDGRTGGSYMGIYRWGYVLHWLYHLHWPEFVTADGGVDPGETISTFTQFMDRWYTSGQRCTPDVDSGSRPGTTMEVPSEICLNGHGFDAGFNGTHNGGYIVPVIKDTLDDTYACAGSCTEE